ncbi:sensor histidine kinase [Paenibacillus pinistramenti]|uniref:sensor histidine kinase n=1 Tax=Paenibacillus pinistramenti TaxID=1768003 RepID=UPI00139691CD|nr:ATP-binding protein [Paenibacillus pinistramenti]
MNLRFRKLMITYILATAALLLLLNAIYYYTMRNTLLDGQKQNIEIMTSHIKSSLEITQKGEMLFEDALADKLRIAAITAQSMLPHKLEDVTNEQLVEVKDKLGIEGLTLFKYLKDQNNFVGAKSTDPKEIGLTTETWGSGKWNKVFAELMEKHEATPIQNFGENLPHFWAGPYDTSSADPTRISKWGYYNDGTTDYLIDPYISEDIINRFHEQAGVEFNISDQVKNNPLVLEVGILNDKILQGDWKAPNPDNPVWHSERMVLYGEYTYTSDDDQKLAEEAFDGMKKVHKVMEINGRMVLRTYSPITLQDNVNKGFDRMLIIVTSDMDKMTSDLVHKEIRMSIVGLVFVLIGALMLVAVVRYIRRQTELVDDVQNMYLQNIESLFKTVKEYRHDFVNHIFAMSGLVKIKKYDELEQYLHSLSHINKSLNDIIDIPIPAFNGLIQAKMAQAMERKIQFEYRFTQFDSLNLDIMKITNLVRVAGNLIDNAFYAVQEEEEDKRRVTILSYIEQKTLIMQVLNTGEPIPEEIQEKIFEHGFSTKPKKSNSGLGLAIVQQITSDYNGRVLLESSSEMTCFTIEIPLGPKELVQQESPVSRQDQSAVGN